MVKPCEAYTPAGRGWERLIMTFPLNGQSDSGQSLYMHENSATDSFHNHYFVLVDDQSDSRFEYPTLEAALKVALNNGGWGQFSIKDITERG